MEALLDVLQLENHISMIPCQESWHRFGERFSVA
jgi:hypothetical protein